MKTFPALMLALTLALPLAARVAVDGRAVEFTAKATGLGPTEALEFAVCGKGSDHDYEALFVADDDAGAIAGAMAKTGIAAGLWPDAFKARLWPQGDKVSVSIRVDGEKAFAPIWEYIDDRGHARGEEGCEEDILKKPFRWTGGAREGGALRAAVESPNAIFALYTHGPSPVLPDGFFDQSATYGRFFPARKLEPGQSVSVRVEWDGKSAVRNEVATIAPDTDLGAVLAALKAKADAAPGDVFVQMAVAPETTVAQAARAAQVFAKIDGRGVKMNGCAPGEFYYGAFIPEEKWRERPGRLFQPFELHVARKDDGSLEKKFVFVEEDWSGEGLDPVLKPHETIFADWSELKRLIETSGPAADKLTVMFIFAPADMKVAELKAVLSAVPPRMATFYVFF